MQDHPRCAAASGDFRGHPDSGPGSPPALASLGRGRPGRHLCIVGAWLGPIPAANDAV